MRLRSHSNVFNSALFLPARTVCVLAGIALFVPVLSGCDGHSSTSATQSAPLVQAVVPAGGTNPTFTVAGATLPQTGTTVTVRVEIANSSNLDVTNNPPKINILGPAGTSVINGPQPLQAVSSDPNGWTYSYNITSGTPTQQYAFVIYAQDKSGNTGNTPFNLGVLTLP